MKTTATLLRGLQFYAHNAHNLAKGEYFFADHEFLGDLYEEYEGNYDSVVERMIGTDGTAPLAEINKTACSMVEGKKADDCELAFKTILATEKDLCRQIAVDSKGASIGTQNLLADLADKSEMRQYKIGRRIMQ